MTWLKVRCPLIFSTLLFLALDAFGAEDLPVDTDATMSNSVGAAEASLRTVYIEWEPIPSAAGYDIEIKTLQMEKPWSRILSSKEAKLRAPLPTGQFQFRVRAKDRRGVTGPWSGFENLTVKMGTVRLLIPSENWEKVADGKESEMVHFAWTKSTAAAGYRVEIQSEDRQFVFAKVTKQTDIDVAIPPGGRFRWSVQTLTASQMNSQMTSRETSDAEIVASSFSLLSQRKTRPAFAPVKNAFVREIQWKIGSYADGVMLNFHRWNSAKDTWEIFHQIETSESFFEVPADWPGGKYRVSAWAKKNGKTISERSELEFELFNGDRSVASEAHFFLSDYLNRTSGLFLWANYILSQVHYEATAPRLNSQTQFEALTGTLSAGAEYLVWDNWGGRAIGNFGGVIIDGKNHTLYGLELDGIWRSRVADLADSRVWMGLLSYQVPQTAVSAATGASDVQTLGVQSLVVGADLWRAWTSEWGYKFHGDFVKAISGQSGFGETLAQGQRWQVGLLATYSWTPQMQWHFGYTFKDEDYRMKAAQSGLSGAEIRIQGHYFNVEFGREF